MGFAIWSVAYLIPVVVYAYVQLIRRRSLLDPLLAGGTYLFLMFLLTTPYHRTVPVTHLLLLHSACAAAYWLGGLGGNRLAARWGKARASHGAALTAAGSAWLWMALATLLLTVFIFVISYDGSLSLLFDMRRRPELLLGSLASTMGTVERLAQYLRGYVAPLGTLAVLFWCRQAKGDPVSIGVLAAVILAWGSLALGGGSRGAVVFLIVQCLFAAAYARTQAGTARLAAKVIVIALLPLAAVTILVQTLFRSTGLPAGQVIERLEQRAAEAGTTVLEHSSFNDEIDFVVSSYPDFYGYTKGHSLYTPVVVFVPRTIWPDKPVPWGRTLAWQYGFRYDTTVSLAATIPGEGYANFGPAGWVLFPLLFGAVIGGLSRLLRYARNEYDVALGIWGVFWALSLRGDMHSAVASIILPYFVSLVVFRILFVRKQRPLTARWVCLEPSLAVAPCPAPGGVR